MKFYCQQNGQLAIVVAASCKQPKMTNHRGRTWASGKITIDGLDHEVWLDTTWSQNCYLFYQEHWYRIAMWGEPMVNEYDLDPFAVPACALVTDARKLRKN